jgi:hypothetical protein
LFQKTDVSIAQNTKNVQKERNVRIKTAKKQTILRTFLYICTKFNLKTIAYDIERNKDI